MLYWLQQSPLVYPPLAEGRPPPGLLHPQEVAQLMALHIPRRRRDWLLGRWTAKHLLQTVLYETTGARPPLLHIVIENESSGAPYAKLIDSHYKAAKRLPLSLSISHSGHRSLCAVSAEETIQVGVDIERIERRDGAFWERVFDSAELSFAKRVIPREQDSFLTALWSVKEAIFKALRLHRRAAPQDISCQFSDFSSSPGRWTPLTLTVAPALLPDDRAPGVCRAWWRVDANYVLALAAWSSDATRDLATEMIHPQ